MARVLLFSKLETGEEGPTWTKGTVSPSNGRLVLNDKKVRAWPQAYVDTHTSKRHTVENTIVGHFVSSKNFFFPLILRSEHVLEIATSFCAAQIGSAPGVACHPSKLLLTDAAGEFFQDALQLAQGLGLLTDNLLLSLRPEAKVRSGLYGGQLCS